MRLETYLAERGDLINQALSRLLPPEECEPAVLHRAMRYSLFAGGKRLRPILCIAAGETLGGRTEDLLVPACSLELIHTYSLIHDDLPALDNDDLRRGKQACHKVFGEAIAILAGDALLTRSFEILSDATLTQMPDLQRIRVIAEIARAAGTTGSLIGGQVADLQAEGKTVSLPQLEAIHRGKTGALIRSAVRVGTLVAGAEETELAALTRYAENVGLAFQIIDDLLDVLGEEKQLGKSKGKDSANKKATFPAVCGIEASRLRADELVASARKSLETIGRDTTILAELAAFAVWRKF